MRNKPEDESRNQLAELEQIYNTAPVGLCFIDTEFRYAILRES